MKKRVDSGGLKERAKRELCIMRSFIICALDEILLG
jgi:hypothetical protein